MSARLKSCRLSFLTNELDAITLVHLPSGPTTYFKLTSIELTKDIFVGRQYMYIYLYDTYGVCFRAMRGRLRTIRN